MSRIRRIGSVLVQLFFFYLRFFGVILVLWVTANAASTLLFPAVDGNDDSARAVFFEERSSGAWSGWEPVAASLQVYPATSTSLVGDFPNPSNSIVRVSITAQRSVGGEPSDVVPPVALIRLNVPLGVESVRNDDQDSFDTQMENMVDQFSMGATYEAVHPAEDPLELSPSETGRFDVEPTLVLVSGDRGSFYLSEYSAVFELPNSMIKRQGIWSGISRIVWSPRLSEFDPGLGEDFDNFDVRACSCGIRVASPDPAGMFVNSTDWGLIAVGSQSEFEYSTDTAFDDFNDWCNTFFLPAALGLVVSAMFSWKRQRDLRAPGSAVASVDTQSPRRARHRRDAEANSSPPG